MYSCIGIQQLTKKSNRSQEIAADGNRRLQNPIDSNILLQPTTKDGNRQKQIAIYIFRFTTNTVGIQQMATNGNRQQQMGTVSNKKEYIATDCNRPFKRPKIESDSNIQQQVCNRWQQMVTDGNSWQASNILNGNKRIWLKLYKRCCDNGRTEYSMSHW